MKRTFIALTSIIWVMLLISITFPAFSGDDMPKDAYEMSEEESLKSGIRPLRLENQTVMPRHDGRHYFIDDGRSVLPSATDAGTTPLAIESAIKISESKMRIENVDAFVNGGWQNLNLSKLPIVIEIGGTKHGGLNATLVITSLIFTKTDTKAQIGILSKMNSNEAQLNDKHEVTSLYFGGELTLKKGGSFSAGLQLIAPLNISLFSLSGIGRLSLSVGTGVCLGCKASETNNPSAFSLRLSGQFEFDPQFVVAEKIDGVAITDDNRVAKMLFGTKITSWGELKIKLSFPQKYGLQFTRFKYIGFWSSTTNPEVSTEICDTNLSDGNVILDLSTNTKQNETARNIISFLNFRLRLPTSLKKSNSDAIFLDLTYLNIDDSGNLNGKMFYNNKVEAKASNGKGFSVDITRAGVTITKNELNEFAIGGDLELPILDGKDLSFDLNKSGELLNFSATLKPDKGDKLRVNLFNADLSFDNTTKTTTASSTNGTKESTSTTTGSAADTFIRGEGSINLNTGAIGAFAVTISKAKLTIVGSGQTYSLRLPMLKVLSESPYINAFTLEPVATTGSQIMGFALSLQNISAAVSTDKKYVNGTATIGAGVQGSEASQQISLKGDFSYEAEILESDKPKFKRTKFGLTGFSIEGHFPSFDFEASVATFENANRLGVDNLTGFEGKGRFGLKLMSPEHSAAMTNEQSPSGGGSTGGGVYIVYAKKSGVENAAWGVDVDIQFGSPGIPLGTVLLKGVFGGVYKNLSMKGDIADKVNGARTGLSYQWNYGAWGFNLGLDMTTAANVDLSIMLAAQSTSSGGLSFKAVGYARYQLQDFMDKIPPVGEKMLTGFKEMGDKVSQIRSNIPIRPTLFKEVAQADEAVAKGASTTSSTSTPQNTATASKNNSLADLFSGKESDKKGPASPNRIALGLVVAYNSGGTDQEGSFSIKMYPDIFINLNVGFGNAALKSTGYGMLYISNSKKYLYIGRANPVSDRLGLVFESKSSALDITAAVNAYFMLGDGVDTELPPPLVPESFAAIFNDKKEDIGVSNQSMLADKRGNPDLAQGTGLAFGAAVSIKIGMNFIGVVKVNAGAGAGFDALLVKTSCPEGWVASSGNSWNAQAQIYGYANADVSVLGVPLLEAGIGVLLRARFPQPFYAEGIFAAYVRVWKAKVSIKVDAKIGENAPRPTCLPASGSDNVAITNWNFVESITPQNTVSPVGNFYLNAIYPVDQLSKLAQSKKYKMEVNITYKKPDQSFFSLEAPLVTISDIDPLDISKISTLIALPRKQLASNTDYDARLSIRIYDPTIQDRRNNTVSTTSDNTTIQFSQIYDFSFKTNNERWDLTDLDVVAYPAKNQYNTYKGDYQGKGYFKLESGLASEINTICTACQFSLGIYEKGNLAGDKTTVNLTDANGTFFSLSQLSSDKIYELKVDYTENGVTKPFYTGHFFRVSKFNTFNEKITAYRANAQVSWNTNNYGFEVITNESVDEGFSLEEKQILFMYLKDTSPWISALNSKWNNTKCVKGDEASYTSDLMLPKPMLTQNNYFSLSNEAVVRNDGEVSPTKAPMFSVLNFNSMINSGVYECLISDNNNQPIPEFVLPQGTNFCVDMISDIKKMGYYQQRNWQSLPSLYSEATNSFCFASRPALDFNDVNTLRKRIVVHCERQERDSTPILYSFELYDSNNQAIEFPSDLKIKHNFLGGNETFSNVKYKAENAVVKYSSLQKSASECASPQDLSVEAAGNYSFSVKVYPRPEIAPCITIRKNNEAIISQVDGMCDADCAPQGDPRVCEICRNDMAAILQNTGSTEFHYIIESWENEVTFQPQKLPRTLYLTLSNGKPIEFHKDNTAVTVVLQPEEEALLVAKKELLKVVIPETEKTYRCGENLDANEYNYKPFAFNGSGATATEACSSSKSVKAYTKADFTAFKVGDFAYEAINPEVKPLSLQYYTMGSGIERKWYAFNNGMLQQVNYCVATPFVHIDCKNKDEVNKKGATYTIGFYTDGSKSVLMKPWSAPAEGYSFTILSGQNKPITFSLTPQEITSSSQLYRYTDEGCKTIIKTDYGDGYTVITPPKTDCESNLKPAKPAIKTSASTVDFGTTISLEGSGCSDGTSYVWSTEETTAIIKPIITNSTDFKLRCLNNKNNCLSEPEYVTINLTPLLIQVSKPTVCADESFTLNASNCTGTINWIANDQRSLGTTQSLSLQLKESSSITLECTVDGKKRYTITDVEVLPSPEPPTIALAPTSSETICFGGNVSINVTKGCSAKETLVWSNQSTGNSLVVSPSVSNTFYAVCKSDQCISTKSNPIAVEVVVPARAVIITGLEINKVCRNTSVSLSVSNCKQNETVVWFKDNITTPIGEGIDLKTQLSATSTFYAKCLRFTKSDRTVKCEGSLSEKVIIEVIDNAALNPSLEISASEICANQSATLTASGCNAGKLEWQLGDGIWSEGASSRVVNEAGVYRVRCNLNNQCFSTNIPSKQLIVNTLPQRPLLSTNKVNNTICAGEQIQLVGTCQQAEIVWTHQSTLVQPITSTAYTAFCQDAKGCRSLQDASIGVSVNNIPKAPVISNSLGRSIICTYENTVIEASCEQGNVVWDSPSKSLSVSNAPVGQITYRAKCESNGCDSEWIDYVLTIAAKPNAPTIQATSLETCFPQTITITALGCSQKTVWSNGQEGSNIQVNKVGMESFSAKCIINDCDSDWSNEVNLRIKEKPEPPALIARDICDGQPTNIEVQFDATGGASLQWLNNSAPQANGIAGNYTYTAVVSRDGCQSESRSVSQRVIPYPSPITISENSECGSTTLTANGGNGTYTWSNGHQGKVLSISNTGEFAVSSANEMCSVSATRAIGFIKQSPPTPAVNVVGATLENGIYKICGNNAVAKIYSDSPSVWYSGDNLINRNSQYLEVRDSQTIRIQAERDGCLSSDIIVSVQSIIVSQPNPIEELQYCGHTQLRSSCPNGDVVWYNNLDSEIGTGGSIQVSNAGTFYAKCRVGSCMSSEVLTHVQPIKINPSATNLTVFANSSQSDCGERTMTFLVNDCPNATPEWSTDGNSWKNVGTAPIFLFNLYMMQVQVNRSMDVQVRCNDRGCVSPSTSYHLDYKPIPSAPSVSLLAKENDCGYILQTLGSSNNGSTIQWSSNYRASLGSGSQISVSHNGVGEVFYAIASLNGCNSANSNGVQSVALDCEPKWVLTKTENRVINGEILVIQTFTNQNPRSFNYNDIKEIISQRCPASLTINDDTAARILAVDDSACKSQTVNWYDVSNPTSPVLIRSQSMSVRGIFTDKTIKVICENLCGTQVEGIKVIK